MTATPQDWTPAELELLRDVDAIIAAELRRAVEDRRTERAAVRTATADADAARAAAVFAELDRQHAERIDRARHAERTRRHYRRQDRTAGLVVGIALTAGLVTFAAVVLAGAILFVGIVNGLGR